MARTHIPVAALAMSGFAFWKAKYLVHIGGEQERRGDAIVAQRISSECSV